MIIQSSCLVLVLLLVADTTGEPEATLLRTLINAQNANHGRYTAGELFAHYRSHQAGDQEFHDYSEVHVVWDQNQSYSDVLQWQLHRQKVKPSPTDGVRNIWFMDNQKATLYAPDNNRVIISAQSVDGHPIETRMMPSRSWYGPLGMPFTWGDLLGLDRTKPVDAANVHIRLKQSSSDQIDVHRTDDKSKSSILMHFSLSKGGNVTSFEINEPRSHFEANGTCDWVTDNRGRIYLKHSTITRYAKDLKRVQSLMLEYDVIKFNPDHRPVKSNFELNVKSLPEGTRIDDNLTGRKSRVGDKPVESMVDQLQSLIEIMRGSGFSSPK